MTAPDIRAQAIEALKAHQPHEDIYLYCTCGVRLADDGFPAHVVDALAEAGLLPTNSRWVAVHDTFTDYENLDHEVITTREEAQRELDSWGGGGRLVGYLYTDWQKAGE